MYVHTRTKLKRRPLLTLVNIRESIYFLDVNVCQHQSRSPFKYTLRYYYHMLLVVCILRPNICNNLHVC